MQPLPIQLPLGLNLREEATFDYFYLGRNQEIVAALKKTASGSGERVIYLCSPCSAGVTHLLKAACHHAYANHLRCVYLACDTLISLSNEVLVGLESLDLICIDNFEQLGGKMHWEEAFFHLYNRVYDAGGRIIIAAKGLPKMINLTLPDLISRLSGGILYKVHQLSDREKLMALQMRAKKRGMDLSEEVGNYLLTHASRELANLFQMLNKLDQAQLSSQRRLTIPFVKDVLKI